MKWFKILCLLFPILVVSSCKKILDTKPSDFLSADNFYSKKANLNAGLNGVYSILKNSSLYGENYQYIMTTATEESIILLATTSTPRIGYFNPTSSDPEATSMWANLYTGIDRANTVLENINTPKDITSAEKASIEGETRFLRAYYYFLLTQWFGDVPLRTSSSKSPDDANMAFTASRDVYDFVINEMTTAQELLEGQKAGTVTNNERVTQTAVQALLARVCLYAAGNPINDNTRYEQAAGWARKVINSGLHHLNPDYRQIFRLQLKDQYDNVNRESIWEVGFYVNANAPETNSGSNVRVGIQSASDIVGRCDGRAVVTPRGFKAYDAINLVAAVGTTATMVADSTPDSRRDWNIANFKYSGGSATTAPSKTILSNTNYWGRYPGKWRREEEIAPHQPTTSPANIPIVRYSDVLLMLAEAENEMDGPTPETVDLINEIRKRAYEESKGRMLQEIKLTNGGSGYTAVPTVTISGGGATKNATARALISGGKVTGVYLSGVGYGYASLPTITITGTGTGATAEAVTLTDSKLKAADYTDQISFRKTIQDERMRELFGEFLRRQDLRRWGILESTVKLLASDAEIGSDTPKINPFPSSQTSPAKVHFVLPGSNISAKDMYLPIPQREMLYNKLAKQNPGY